MKRKRVGIELRGFTPYLDSENKNPTITRVGGDIGNEESTTDHSSDEFSDCIDSMEESESSSSSLEPVDMALKNGLLKSAAPVKNNVFVTPGYLIDLCGFLSIRFFVSLCLGICTDSVKPLSTSCSRPRTDIGREIGEPSCCYCVICGDAKPVMSTVRSQYCKHRFCVDCFQVSIAGRMNEENISSVKCPEKKCKMELGHEYTSPKKCTIERSWDILRADVLHSGRQSNAPTATLSFLTIKGVS